MPAIQQASSTARPVTQWSGFSSPCPHGLKEMIVSTLSIRKIENQPAAKVDVGDAVHVVVLVIEVEHILEPERRRHPEVVLLVAQNVLGRAVPAASLVVARANDIARVALAA